MTFGEKIRELRKTKTHMSQTELAHAVGVSLRTVRGWEIEGRCPKKREVYGKLAEVFGCDVSYLMTEDDAFITEATEKYGYHGRKQAEQLVSELGGMFVGGELSEEDKDAVMRAIQDAYWHAKDEKRRKYTPKKYLPED